MTPVTSRSIVRSERGIKYRKTRSIPAAPQQTQLPCSHSTSSDNPRRRTPSLGTAVGAAPGNAQFCMLGSWRSTQRVQAWPSTWHDAAMRAGHGGGGVRQLNVNPVAGLHAGDRGVQDPPVALDLGQLRIGDAQREPTVTLLVVGPRQLDPVAQCPQPDRDVDPAPAIGGRIRSNRALFLDDRRRPPVHGHDPSHLHVDLCRTIFVRRHCRGGHFEHQVVAYPSVGDLDSVDEDPAPRPEDSTMVYVVRRGILGDDGAADGIHGMDVVGAPGLSSRGRPASIEEYRERRPPRAARRRRFAALRRATNLPDAAGSRIQASIASRMSARAAPGSRQAARRRSTPRSGHAWVTPVPY